MVFCRIPDLEGDNTKIFTIEKVCLAVPASARRGIISTLLAICLFYLFYSMAYIADKRQYHEKYYARKLLLILILNAERGHSIPCCRPRHIMTPVAPKSFSFAHAPSAIAPRKRDELATVLSLTLINNPHPVLSRINSYQSCLEIGLLRNNLFLAGVRKYTSIT